MTPREHRQMGQGVGTAGLTERMALKGTDGSVAQDVGRENWDQAPRSGRAASLSVPSCAGNCRGRGKAGPFATDVRYAARTFAEVLNVTQLWVLPGVVMTP